MADDGTATIISGNLTVTTDNAKANGTSTISVQASVTYAKGNVVPNVAVSFAANNGATLTTASANTDENGLATTTLTNRSDAHTSEHQSLRVISEAVVG
ncbi:Ig-like domain-containing protein, partial [Hafnia paralvei]|uniref:Ig-like domain-containing protein n=1 Tax=Hafnia paralvei TaxID=546367 RepID=UPI00358DA112